MQSRSKNNPLRLAGVLGLVAVLLWWCGPSMAQGQSGSKGNPMRLPKSMGNSPSHSVWRLL
ncbi:MAG TPA: hypothetical protein ENJ09_02610 [Planctomycetes bacterium]|nr:hypothetical protein [Planctomycetota bacterium]